MLRQQYVLALPANHKLCAHSSLTLDMIGNEPLILFPRTRHPHMRDCFDECFKLSGFKPNVIQELVAKHTTSALFKAGIGLAIVPESSMIYSPSGVELRKLDSNLPRIELSSVISIALTCVITCFFILESSQIKFM